MNFSKFFKCYLQIVLYFVYLTSMLNPTLELSFFEHLRITETHLVCQSLGLY